MRQAVQQLCFFYMAWNWEGEEEAEADGSVMGELDFEHRYDIGWWHADAAEWSGVVNVPLALALVAWWSGCIVSLEKINWKVTDETIFKATE